MVLIGAQMGNPGWCSIPTVRGRAAQLPTVLPALLMRRIVEQRVVSLLSVVLVLELEAVLIRPEQLAATGLTPALVQGFVDELCAWQGPVQIHFAWRPQLHDAADEMVLEAAVNGGRCTGLPSTPRILPPAQHFGVEVLAPVTALRVLICWIVDCIKKGSP